MDARSTPKSEPAPASTAQRARKRRPPSPTEQNRRVAWGKRESAQEVAEKKAGRWKELE